MRKCLWSKYNITTPQLQIIFQLGFQANVISRTRRHPGRASRLTRLRNEAANESNLFATRIHRPNEISGLLVEQVQTRRDA